MLARDYLTEVLLENLLNAVLGHKNGIDQLLYKYPGINYASETNLATDSLEYSPSLLGEFNAFVTGRVAAKQRF